MIRVVTRRGFKAGTMGPCRSCGRREVNARADAEAHMLVIRDDRYDPTLLDESLTCVLCSACARLLAITILEEQGL